MFKPTLIPMHHYDIIYAGQAALQEGVAGCKARQAYSPENIFTDQNRLCCLQPNLRANTIHQALSAGWNGKEARTKFKETIDACCKLYPIDSLKTIIDCNYPH